MAGILQDLHASLAQLAKSSELQTETLLSFREDFSLRSDNEESDEVSAENETTGGNTPDIEFTVNKVLDTHSNNSTEKMTPGKNPELGSRTSLIDSLTQAYTSSHKTSPAIEGKIDKLVNNMLGDISLFAYRILSLADEFSAIVDTDFLSQLVLNFKAGCETIKTTGSQ